jgi:CheY-like chemotaxis protein
VRGLRALVVDDLETSRLIMSNLFDAWGMRADTAATAEEGLARLAQSQAVGEPYDVVLLDWRMPGMDGVEMAREMRAQAGPAGCPPFAIMVTAFGREQLMNDGDDQLLDVVLTKPVVPSALFDILMRLRHKEIARTACHAPSVATMRFDGASVLLVEDNPLNQEVASEFLLGLGVRVSVAGNGLEAVAASADQRFDLVLMDLHMPQMDGATAAREITARTGPQPPIVAMTAAVLSEDRALCSAAGMVDFVPKPVDPDDLVRVLRRWLPPDLVAENAARVASGPAAAAVSVQAHEAVALPELTAFDAAAALRRLHGNREQLARLLRSFSTQHGDSARQIARWLASDSIAQAAHALHTLKGISATLGLVGISSASRALEVALEEAHESRGSGAAHAAVQRCLTRLDATLTEAVSSIAALVDAPAPISQPLLTIDPFAMAHLLRELRRYVNEQELIPDALLDELKHLAGGEAPHGRIATLLQHIFDFDNAQALVDIEQIEGALQTER